MEENIVEELSRKYCKKENVIKAMIKKCSMLGFDVEDSIKYIKEFYKK